MKFIGIIPARYASSRFPGKPLADICGMTMIERVYRRASMELDEVYVATDDDRIAETVKGFGGRVVGSDADVVINIQGDEPFIDPSQIAEVKRCFDDESTRIATLVRKFDPALGFEALFDANTPKVTFDDNMNALYFSRSIIPYVRNFKWQEWIDRCTFYTHVGMYAYRAATLAELTSLPQSSLELAESLEQLRWLQNGYKIKVGVTECPTIGIDTPDDLKRAVELCKTLEEKQ